MKKIIVACGSGVATSQNVATRLSLLLDEHLGGQGYEVVPVDIKSIDNEVKQADIYISLVPEAKNMGYSIPVFDGIAFLTGINQEEELNKIIEEIKK